MVPDGTNSRYAPDAMAGAIPFGGPTVERLPDPDAP
jgi:hypothetical protein